MTNPPINPPLKGGFGDPVQDSQRVFRALLDAMAQPGRIVMPPQPPEIPLSLHPASAAVCLALLDFETPVWLSTADAETRAWLAFHTGCPFTATPDQAIFALVADAKDLPPLDSFSLGSDESPEGATTLLLQVGALGNQFGPRLSGPGIDGTRTLAVGGLSPAFWTQRALACGQPPRGLDIILTAGASLAALPRTTQVEV